MNNLINTNTYNDNDCEKIKTVRNGWIDLRGLRYKNAGTIDWEKSIGTVIPFKYDDIESNIVIIGKKDLQHIEIKIPGYTDYYAIAIWQLKNCQIGTALKRITSDFKYEVGDVVNGILITGRRRAPKGKKYYDYKCLKDDYENSIREDHLVNNHGCPVCTNRAVLKGVNDVATTRPDMLPLFLYQDDAYKYMQHSRRQVYFKCPICGNIIYAYIDDVSNKGLSCKRCSDGISYPNKFVYNMIEQLSKKYKNTELSFNFYPEKTFDWSKYVLHDNPKIAGKKIYDMYIDKHNIIIENHGAQHFRIKEFHSYKNARTFEEGQINDQLKMDTALQFGFSAEKYVVLDCSKSNLEYIKQSVMNSKLPLLLNFSEQDIDWNLCDYFASHSRVYEACQLWNQGIRDAHEIACIMRMDRNTINRYIKRGINIGIIQQTQQND